MIDPNISLNVKTPQPEDPLQAYGKAISLRNLMEQGPIQQQNLQALQLENQQRQLDLQDNQTMRRAYMDSNGDLGKMQSLIAQYGGVSPKTMMALNQSILQQKKSLADLDTSKLKATELRHDQLRGLVQQISQAPPESRQATYHDILLRARADNLITDDELSRLPATVPDDTGIKEWSNGLASGSQLIKEENERRTGNAATIRANAAATSAQTGQDRLNLEKPTIAAKGTEEAIKVAGMTVPDNQQDWDSWRTGLPEALRSRISPMYSPEAMQKVREMALTPSERAAISQRNQELGIRNKELGVHQQVANQGEERIGIERQGLQLRKQLADPYNMLGINPQANAETPAANAGAAASATNKGDAFLSTLNPDTAKEVKYWAQKIGEDSKNSTILGNQNKPLSMAVRHYMAMSGADINNIDAQTRDASVFAKKALSHIDTINKVIDDLDAKGKLGPVSSRWNDFMTGKVGSGADFATLRNNIGLLDTAMGRVHGGARGGGSQVMMDHFKSMLNAKTMDAATLKSSMAVYKDWLQHYAEMSPSGGGTAGTPAPTPAPKTYQHVMVSPDGKDRIGSDDGKMWFKVATGEKIQ